MQNMTSLPPMTLNLGNPGDHAVFLAQVVQNHGIFPLALSLNAKPEISFFLAF